MLKPWLVKHGKPLVNLYKKEGLTNSYHTLIMVQKRRRRSVKRRRHPQKGSGFMDNILNSKEIQNLKRYMKNVNPRLTKQTGSMKQNLKNMKKHHDRTFKGTMWDWSNPF